MAQFIIKTDFSATIRPEDLDLITNSTDAVWESRCNSTIEYVSSFLRHRYDVEAVFKPINEYDDVDWKLGDRVIDMGDIYHAIQDVPQGTLLSDTLYWTKADNRNKKIVEVCVDIILYGIYNRLNGSEIPNFLQIRYDGGDVQQRGGAIGYLKDIAKGTIQPDLPLLADVISGVDQSGNRIAHGNATFAFYKSSTI